MSDPRPPDDGPGRPERDLDEKGSEEPAAGWSDDPYRYEPPPRYEPPAWDPPVFEPPKEGDSPAWEPPVWEPLDDEQPATDTRRAEEQPAEEQPADEQPAWEPPAWEPPAVEASPADLPSGEERQEAELPADEPPAWEPPAWEPRAIDASLADLPSGEERLEAELPAEAPPTWERPAWDQPIAEEPLENIQRAEEQPLAAEEQPLADEEPPLAIEEPPLAVEEPLAVDEATPDEEQPFAEEQPLAAEEPQPADEEPPLAADERQPPADEPQPDQPFNTLPQPEPPLAAEEPLLVEAAEPTTAFEGSADAWDPKRHGNRRRSTTAEQAVPWLIGIILALAGMVIVLLALIFSSPNGLVAGQPTDTARPSASQASTPAVASGGPSDEASGSAEPSADPTSTPQPTYGALEMVYLGRPSAAAHIYLLRRDFAKGKDAEVLAQADQGIEKFAWSPDGQVGAAVISDRAVALRPGHPAKQLADRVSALTFGWDSETVYGVRIIRDGNRDHANILEIDFVSGATKRLAEIEYAHPLTAPDPPLTEAQFIDEGGQVRIYAVADGNLVVWILGAPDAYRVDPANGKVTKVTRPPTLWSPDGRQRISPHESGNKTILRLRDRNDDVTASISVTGLVSHVRWAGSSNEIVFTLGRLSAIGGVRQDLYVWDLRDGKDPMPLTSSGAAFGADWRGAMQNWAP